MVGVLVLSQYVEERYATELLSDRPQGVGYLLKDRVADLAEFLDALGRVAAGAAPSIPRSSRSCSRAAVIRWPASPRASARCSP
jgi:hypothetical protein